MKLFQLTKNSDFCIILFLLLLGTSCYHPYVDKSFIISFKV